MYIYIYIYISSHTLKKILILKALLKFIVMSIEFINYLNYYVLHFVFELYNYVYNYILN